MVAILLYLPTAIGLIALWHRFVQPISRTAAIVLVLLPFCFTGRALLTGAVYGPIDLPFMSEPLIDYRADFGIYKGHNGTLSDLYSQMIPWQSAVRESLAAGEWPLWNRHMLAGSVLAANMQSAPYDPLQLLSFLLPQAQAMTFCAAMTFLFAGLFTFAFVRAIGCGEAGALIAGTAYMFSAMMAFFVEWPLGRVWTFLPLILVGVRLVVRETSVRSAVVLTSGFVLMIFAGHPESMLHIAAIGAAYGIYEIASTRERGLRAPLRSIGLATACGVIALLLTAVSLLPFLSAAPETFEYTTRHQLYAATDLAIPPGKVFQRAGVSLFPFFGGRGDYPYQTSLWEPTSMRVGSIVLALALASTVLAPRRDTWFFLALLAVTAMAGLNAWPVAQFLHKLPLFDITINERFVFAAAFCLSMLAGLAVDGWPRAPGRELAAAIIVLAVGLGLAAGTRAILGEQFRAGVDPDIIVSVILVELLPLAIMALLLVLRTPPRIVVPLLLGLLLVQRTMEDGVNYPTLAPKLFYPNVPLLRYIQDDAAKSPAPFRIVGMFHALVPDGAALYGLEDIRGYEAMTFLRLVQTYPSWCTPMDVSFNKVWEKDAPFVTLLNVKYAIGYHNQEPDEQWKLVLEDRKSRLFENRHFLPRAFIPRHIRYEQSPGVIAAAVNSAKDFRDMAWIEAPEYPPHEIGNGPGTLEIERDGVSGFDIDANMEADGWVVVSESAWKGWRAYVDGKRVEWKYADHALIGVYLLPGQHHIRLVYLPESFTRGRAISFITLAALVFYFLDRERQRRGWSRGLARS